MTCIPEIHIRRIRPDANLPVFATQGAAGADLRACLECGETLIIAPGAKAMVPTGLSLAIEPGWELQIRPRSGLAVKNGVTVLNAPGTIDSDYRGEVKVILINHGSDPFEVRTGDRIAQAVVAQAVRPILREVDALDETSRGAGGFGSTGLR